MKKRKGIILAGGSGTRLYPLTIGVSKQLLPVYDKPMIYYPLSVLMQAGVEEIAIITTPQDQGAFRCLLGDGGAEGFLAGAPSVLVLGDNIFHGEGLGRLLAAADRQQIGGHIFGYPVRDPRSYGVIETDAAGRVRSIEEKPARQKSRLAATGLYFLDHEAPARAGSLRPSRRGELEITTLLETYLADETLEVTGLGRRFAWFDTGTHDSLHEAAGFIRAQQRRHGVLIGSPEEIAYRRGLIDAEQLMRLTHRLSKTGYGAHLRDLAETGLPTEPVPLRRIA
jgi:glucose-1-phosphate thymidylyltransferase